MVAGERSAGLPGGMPAPPESPLPGSLSAAQFSAKSSWTAASFSRQLRLRLSAATKVAAKSGPEGPGSGAGADAEALSGLADTGSKFHRAKRPASPMRRGLVLPAWATNGWSYDGLNRVLTLCPGAHIGLTYCASTPGLSMSASARPVRLVTQS